MASILTEERFVSIPSEVTVKLEGKILTVNGPLGELKKDFSHAKVHIELVGDKIVVKSLGSKRTDKAIVGTISTHIKNMVKGVTKGFTYKLKKVYSHFPINVKVSGNKILIENFIGERSPRIAKIVGNVKVIVKGDDVEVQGLDLEAVSQTAENIQQATKIKKKDPRVFLDGIYIYKKTEGMSG